jgi:hypothetical protein
MVADLMGELNMLAIIYNVTLPLGLIAATTAFVLAIRHKRPVSTLAIISALFILSMLPGIPVMNHFNAVHGSDINIWGQEVWWMPD